MEKMDVFFTSASRPDLLKRSFDSFLENVTYAPGFRFLINEDIIYPDKSTEVLHWARDTKQFDVIVHNNPTKGMTLAYVNFATNHFKSELMFNMQDDWTFKRKVDLDESAQIMKEYKDINQIRYNKRDTMPYKGEGVRKQMKKLVMFDEYSMYTSGSWTVNPSLWRMTFIRPYLKVDVRHQAGTYAYKLIHEMCEQRGVKYKFEDFSALFGAYIFGKLDEKAFVKHIGGGDRHIESKGKH